MKKIILLLIAQMCCVLYCSAQNDTIYDDSDCYVLWVDNGEYYLSIHNSDVCVNRKMIIHLGSDIDEVESTLLCMENYDESDELELRSRIAFLCLSKPEGLECVGISRSKDMLQKAELMFQCLNIEEVILSLEELTDVK